MIKTSWGSATDVGRVRAVNEDRLLARCPVFAVADGMGGHAAGEVASQLAIRALEPLTLGSGPLLAHQSIDALARANTTILEHASDHPDTQGMGSTLAMLTIVEVGGVLHWGALHVGDCRIYRLGRGTLMRLTTDHTEVADLVSRGQLSEEEARNHPRRNVVTQSLGTVPPPATDWLVFPPAPPERFLICSDGLTAELSDEQIAQILGDIADPQEAAEALVASAVDAGGRDNITVVIVDDWEAPESPGADEDTLPRLGHER